MAPPTTQGQPSPRAGKPSVMLLVLRHPDAPWSEWLAPQCPPDLFGFPFTDSIITSGALAARIHPADSGAFKAVRDQLQETGSARWSYRIRHADGRYRWVHEEWMRIGGADDDRRRAACVLVTAGPRRLPARLNERASERLRGFVAGCHHSMASGPGGERLSNVLHGSSDRLWDCEAEIRRIKESLELEIARRTAALRESESRFRQLAEAAPDGIAITEDARIVDGNTQLAAMSGWELKEIIGRSVWDFIPEHARKMVAERLREDSSPAYGSHVLRKDGSELPVEISGRTMLWQGKPRRVTLLRDRTATRQATEQMEALRSALERGRRFAEISEISAAVVHQLGQPFTAITANVSALLNLLSQGKLQQDCAEETLRAIEAGLRHVREIMTHLRTLIHPDQAKREPVNLGQVVSEVLRLLRAEAEQRKVSISFDSAPGLPVVSVDRVQISQLIFNLIRNAFDAVAACPTERRHVDISTATVDGASVRMTVRDLGSGIASEVKPHIFDAFFTTKPDGMGVGLRISRTIAETYGGSLQGDNNPDGPGASFTVVLPIEQEPDRRGPRR